METFLIIAVFQAFLLGFLLLIKRGRCHSDLMLSAYLFISGITILFAYIEIYNRNHGYPFPILINVSPVLIMLHGPLLWFYVKVLTSQRFAYKPIYLLHFAPFVFVAFLFWVGFYSQPLVRRIELDSSDLVRDEWLFLTVVALIAISTQGYYLWALLLIKRYKRKLKLFLSRVESIDLKWLKFLLTSAIIFYASVSGLYMADIAFGLLPYNLLQLSGFVMASVFVFILGVFGLRQGNVFASYPVDLDVDRVVDSRSCEGDISKQDEAFVHKLLSYMKEQQPHLNSELTLATLSKALGVTPEYLSSILNGRLCLNFFDFVNHHRVESFKQKCKDPQNRNQTLIGLAYDSGFNSKATFNRVFKREMNCTPSEFFTRCNGS